MPPKNNKEFNTLQKEWYSKLKDSGFEDIEQNELDLKLWSSHFFKVRHNATLFSAKEEYYRMAGHFLYDYTFSNEHEKQIWALHSTGVSIRGIVDQLKAKKIKTDTKKVNNIIKAFSKLMIRMSVTQED